MSYNCRDITMSEDYVDLLIPLDGISKANGICGQVIGGMYEVQHWLLGEGQLLPSGNIGYYVIPKLYGLLDTGSMEASGIPEIQNQPILALQGNGIPDFDNQFQYQ